jgi:hypothetical protein
MIGKWLIFVVLRIPALSTLLLCHIGLDPVICISYFYLLKHNTFLVVILMWVFFF